MKLPRRNFLHLAASAAALPVVSRIARAQAYPARPVRLIVPVAPAGAADITARLMGQWLSERLGQPFVIDNRPGGGTNIATEAVVHASADGYTLLLCGVFNATNAAFYDKLNFNFLRDIAPVPGVFRGPYVMVVHPSVPARSVPEFIAYAKPLPAKSTWRRRAPAPRPIWPASCSRWWPVSTWSTCPIAVAGRRSPISSPGRCRSTSPPLSRRSSMSGLAGWRARGHHGRSLGGASGHPDRGWVRAGL